MLFGTYFIYDKFASFFRALLALKSMQDPCKFTLNSATYRPINLKFIVELSSLPPRFKFKGGGILIRSRRVLYRPRLGALF